MLLCDIEAVGASTHYLHLALHLGLASLVSVGGGVFLTLGVVAHRRAIRAAAAARALDRVLR
jgi:hypothetical protein